MNPFAVDYCDLDSVIRFARRMFQKNPRLPMYVYKHPERENYNITGQLALATAEGAVLVWQSK